MEGDPQFLSDMLRCKARRIGNDGVGHEWILVAHWTVLANNAPSLKKHIPHTHLCIVLISLVIGGVDASTPHALKHLIHLRPAATDFASLDCVNIWDESGILDLRRRNQQTSQPCPVSWLLTMKAMSSAGLPPTEKNSKPESFSTNSLNAGCVARRTRWP